MDVIVEINTTIEATVEINAGGTGTCADATVVNSNGTYSQTVASGGIHTLADITYRVYANGELISTTTNLAMSDYVINIED